MFTPDLSVTGAAQTGFTSPVYTLAADLAPDASSRQWFTSALGGTQAGARAHTAGDPFTLTIRRGPYRALGSRNPVNGSYGNVPKNKIEILTRKGVKIDVDGTLQVLNLRVIAEIPAGSEVNDAPNIRAAVSMLLGQMAEVASGYGDTLVQGTL